MATLTVTFGSAIQATIPTRGYAVATDTPGHTSPPQLFIASLAACVGVYVQNYCEHRNLESEGLAITAQYEKAQDAPARIAAVAITIKLPDTISSQHYENILRVANQCLIHKTIEHQPALSIKLLNQL